MRRRLRPPPPTSLTHNVLPDLFYVIRLYRCDHVRARASRRASRDPPSARGGWRQPAPRRIGVSDPFGEPAQVCRTDANCCQPIARSGRALLAHERLSCRGDCVIIATTHPDTRSSEVEEASWIRLILQSASRTCEGCATDVRDIGRSPRHRLRKFTMGKSRPNLINHPLPPSASVHGDNRQFA